MSLKPKLRTEKILRLADASFKINEVNVTQLNPQIVKDDTVKHVQEQVGLHIQEPVEYFDLIPVPGSSNEEYILQPSITGEIYLDVSTCNPISIELEPVSLQDNIDYMDCTQSNRDENYKLGSAATNQEELIVGESGKRKSKGVNKTDLQKYKKNKGEFYIGRTKAHKPAKVMKSDPCFHKKCQNSCSIKFSETDRLHIFKYYWELQTRVEKQAFLISCVEATEIKRKYTQGFSRRSRSLNYFLPKDVNKIKVCQQFILKTLDVSQRLLQYSYDSKSELNTPKIDLRGKVTPPNKTPVHDRKYAVDFIKMLPAVPSHYCRGSTNKKYLPSDFRNLSNVYRIYKKDCVTSNRKFVGEKVFKDIFRNDFNIGIHKPKKDKCALCSKYEEETERAEADILKYQLHIIEKKATNANFLKDQERAKTDSSFICSSFDLQKVLNTPHGENMLLYYSRKYAVYNLTFYESGSRDGFCFVWGEADGKRGANEIASIVSLYLKKVDERKSVSEVALYCDSCPGQNKNRQLWAAVYTFLQFAENIKAININYLLPGHTYMPVDSMHACIESAYRKKVVWAPSEWPTILTNCRIVPRPYSVEVLNYKSFRNWKDIQENLFPNTLFVAANGKKVSIREVRRIIINKNNKEINIINSFKDEANEYICKIRDGRRRVNFGLSSIRQAYTERLPIPVLKYSDLLNLCKKGIIPQRYHEEYKNIPNKSTVPDNLPETDEEDEENF